MTITQQQFGDATIYKPTNRLKNKVGFGGIDPECLIRAQYLIENNTQDFLPIAEGYLATLEKHIKKIEKSSYKAGVREIDAMIAPVLHLKGQGTMFKYPLITKVCSLLLDFLHEVQTTDTHVLEVVNVHKMTLQAITAGKIMGTGGKQGEALLDGLDKACKHYFQVIAPYS